MKTLRRSAYALFIILLFNSNLFSQNFDKGEVSQALYKEIIRMDSLLFKVAFNECDIELFEKILSPELEFYDDRSGLNTSFEKEIASIKDKCSKPFKVTRELVDCSVHILGDYGAVQIGVHDFFVDGEKVETAKFITVWEKTGNFWIVKRAISYDHEEASK